MKRLFLLLLINATFFIGYSQTQGLQTYTAFDNSVFNVGDSITIGYYSGYEKYDYIKEQYYKSQYDNGIRKIKGGVYNTKHKIIKIEKDYTALWDTSAYIVEIGETGFLKGYKYYVNINEAVRNGEIIISKSPFESYKSQIKLFNDSLAFLFKVKQSTKPTQDFALEYLFRFKNKIYEKYKEDEFELDNQKQIAIEILNKNTATLDTASTYYCNIELSVDNYDFTTNSFPIGGFSESYTLIKDVYFGFPATQLAFINKDKYTRVLVEKATANNFVKRRKDKHGNVNRAIYARVYFKNVQVITKSSNPALIASYENYLFAEIQKIEFFDFKNWVYNYIGHIN